VSDIYSLGVITYEMLTGKLPYGEKEMTMRRLRRARYRPAIQVNPDVPVWMGRAIEKAVAIPRNRCYALLSEFIHDLAHPNTAFVSGNAEPLIERNPLLVWKGIAFLLFLTNLFFMYLITKQ
jgi:serine/threonine protein kinase